jgi:AraC-like DNA-binding protein
MINGLKSNGVAFDNITQKGNLKRFDLNNPDTYLPLEVTYELFNKVKHSQGVDCISSEFYSGFQLEELSDYGQFVSSLPDLKSILLNAIKYEPLIQTNSKATLQTVDNLLWFSIPHLDAPSEGRQVSERINIAMMLKLMQLVLGKDWVPLEIHVTSPDGYWLQNLVPSGNFRLKTNCPEIAICFKAEELNEKNKRYSNKYKLHHVGVDSIEDITTSVFHSLNGNYFPTLEELSEYFGYSKRTIIREFLKANTSYKEVLDKFRFNSAVQLIQETSLSIDQIRTELGYSTSSNFIRAFRRWTGLTPRQYRTMNIS